MTLLTPISGTTAHGNLEEHWSRAFDAPLLGTITLGHAPREDITSTVTRHLPCHARYIDVGALDGLERDEVQRLYSPGPGEESLITRLPDGFPVIVGKNKLLPRIRLKMEALRSQGCRFVLLLCTGEFHGLRCDGTWLIEPDRILSPSVAAIAGNRQTGILVPLPDQTCSKGGKWDVLERKPFYRAASPFLADAKPLEHASRELREQGAELLVLDCMAYTEAHRETATRASGLPVILSNALIGRLLAELLS